MVIDDLEPLSGALERGDLAALEAMADSRPRRLNASMSFRSALMLSAHNLKHLNKLDELEAECVMLNLEDGVSEAQKPLALRLCALFLSRLPRCDRKLVVRVNPLGEGGEAEIAYLSPFRPDAIRIPKVRSLADVDAAAALIPEPIELHLSIETADAWLALASLASHPRVKAVYLGFLDLFADLGLAQSLIEPDNPALLYMLSHFLITARAAGAKPVSFVFQDYRDLETFGRWLVLEKRMGFDAKGCLSPAQVGEVHKVFGRDEAEYRRARDIVALFEANAKNGVTGFVDERYGFIDEPIYKGALALLNDQ